MLYQMIAATLDNQIGYQNVEFSKQKIYVRKIDANGITNLNNA